MSGTQELWLDTVERITRKCARGVMVSVCCGAATVEKRLDFPVVEACDLNEPPQPLPDHWRFTQRSAIPFLEAFPCKYADLVICSDGLEHFTRAQGLLLLRQMERVGKHAIIFTPTGDTTFNPESTEPHDHKSSWSATDFAKLGWESDHFPDWHPTIGWGALFAWSQIS